MLPNNTHNTHTHTYTYILFRITIPTHGGFLSLVRKNYNNPLQIEKYITAKSRGNTNKRTINVKRIIN